ncbi:hypothetical protein V6N13_101220 [Hibiscus sabdariffa]
MKAGLGLHMMKRITSATPAFILPSTGNSLPFSLSKLRITCFRSVNSTASVENDNMGLSKPTHLEILVIDKCKSRSLELDEALGFFNSIISMRPLPSIVAFNHLLGAVSKMKHYALVVSMCKQMMGCSEFQPDVVAMNIWLSCLCNLKKVDLGFSVFAMIIKLGLQPYPYTMNALLLGLIEEGKIVEAMGLFWKIMKNGYLCNQYTYGIIIKGLCRSGNFRLAVVLLIKMKGNGSFEPNVVCYNTIIDGFCKEKQMDKSLIIFQDMLDRKIEPNVVTFGSLINGFCSIGQWDEAKRLLSAMVNKGISPNVYILNALIAPLCKDGKIQEAISLINLMTQKGTKPNAVTYNMLIHSLCKFGGEVIKGDSNSGTNDSYRTMIGMYCALGEMNKAKDVFDSMETHGFAPDLAAYKMLINGYAKSKRKVDTVRLAEEMLQKGLTLDMETHTLLRGFLCFTFQNPSLYPRRKDRAPNFIGHIFCIKVLEEGRQREAKRIQLGLNQDIIWLIFFGISGGSISSKVKGCQLQICQSSPFFRKPRPSKSR